MNIVEINNGVRLHFVKSDIFNTCSVAVMLRQPLKRESVSENILIANMLKRGTQKLKTMREISKHLQMLWGSDVESYAMKKGSEQIITVYGEALNKEDNFIKLCRIVLEIFSDPLKETGGFCEKYFDEEKENAINALKDKANDKKEYAKEKCREIMYGEVCGDGYEEDIKKCDRKKAYENYINMLKSGNIEILTAGDTDRETEKEITNMCKKIFEGNRKPDKIPEKNNSDIKYNKENIINMNVEQCRLCIGYKTDIKPESNQIYALAAGNEILGGSGNSKLFANVREKKGLCYYIGSKIQRFEGDIITESGIKKEDYEDAVKSIDEEFEKIKKGDFSDEDFKNAVSTLKKKYLLINDSENAQLDFYANSIILNSPSDRDEIIKIIENITKEQICKSMESAEKATTVFICGGDGNEK